MKKVSTKSLMVIALVVASFTATPMMVAGYDYDNDYNYDQIGITDPTALIGGFGSIFGMMFRSLGPGGNVLATVFEMLFMQTLSNFSGKEILPGVYAISATQEKTISDLRDFTTPRRQFYRVPLDYIEGAYNVSKYGYAYCEVVTQGSYEYNLTIGAGVTLIIWDNDGSFVTAVKKIINFFTELEPYISSPSISSTTSPSTSSIGGIPEELIQKGVEIITWFLIHINDIFTGEELFVLNPITWEKLEIQTSAGFSINKTWKVTGSDWEIDPADKNLDVAISGGATLLVSWNITAQARKDSYMKWLLTEAEIVANLRREFTSFTFDLFQLWIKNFEIHIDVAEILSLLGGGGGSINPAAIFQGLDIEFFLFTHHLTGAFLYNDTNFDNRLSANYVQINNSVGDPVLVDGRPIEVPRSSEITHKLMIGTVNDFDFTKPTLDGKKVSWGLTLDQATLKPVPMGVDLDSYLGVTEESLAYIHFGFTFEPEEIELPTVEGGTVPVLHGAVKLDQFFAPWNGPLGANNSIAGLDLAIIYVSTVLHFHLNLQTIGDDPTARLDPAEDYYETTRSLKIGNYLPHNIKDKLEFVDIAGPDYSYGLNEGDNYAPASTSILPVALFKVEANAHKTFEGTPGEVDTFAADIGLNITFSAMVYAVCFPEFEDGNGIWHDPTFSVFMVFEATGFWALILLVAGVGLLGVATILIKRRKDARF